MHHIPPGPGSPSVHGHDIVVFGASAGGIETLQRIIRQLPHRFPAAIFVVAHLNPQLPSHLAQVLSKSGRLQAVMVDRTLRFRRGMIYVAPPDHHLILTKTEVRINRGPRENWHRPAVDVLFRTAAEALGPRVVGVVLSGFLHDGSAGLAAVRRRGGVTIVQDPGDALFPDMPLNALQAAKPDYCIPASRIPETLLRVVKEGAKPSRKPARTSAVAIESQIAKASIDPRKGLRTIGKPSTFVCPECQGPLWEMKNGAQLRYRCQVGHAFSAESMLNAQKDLVERSLWVALGTLQSRAALWRRVVQRMKGPGTREAARYYRSRERETRGDIRELRRILTRAGKPSNGVGRPPPPVT